MSITEDKQDSTHNKPLHNGGTGGRARAPGFTVTRYDPKLVNIGENMSYDNICPIYRHLQGEARAEP